MGDYKARVIEAHGRKAFSSRVSNRNKDRPPRAVQDVRVPASKSEQARVDLAKEEGEDDGESADLEDSGSSPIYTSGGEENKANTHVPSAPQQEATRSRKESPKRLALALTPRHARKRTTTTSWAKPEPIRSTSFRERLGFSEPPERRGWDT